MFCFPVLHDPDQSTALSSLATGTSSEPGPVYSICWVLRFPYIAVIQFTSTALISLAARTSSEPVPVHSICFGLRFLYCTLNCCYPSLETECTA